MFFYDSDAINGTFPDRGIRLREWTATITPTGLNHGIKPRALVVLSARYCATPRVRLSWWR